MIKGKKMVIKEKIKNTVLKSRVTGILRGKYGEK